MSEDNKSLFFLVLSLGCIWLILDNVYGNKYITLALSKLFDFVDSPTVSNTNYKDSTLYKNLTEDMDEEQKKTFNDIIEYKTGKKDKAETDTEAVKKEWTVTF